jgi:hypothetical protein
MTGLPQHRPSACRRQRAESEWEAHTLGGPAPAAPCVSWLAHWHAGTLGPHQKSSSSRRRHRKSGGEKSVSSRQTRGQTPRHTIAGSVQGQACRRNRGSGCMSGQLQGAPLKHICKPRQGHMELLGPGGFPATIADRWDPEERTGRWAVSENGSAPCDGKGGVTGVTSPPAAFFGSILGESPAVPDST